MDLHKKLAELQGEYQILVTQLQHLQSQVTQRQTMAVEVQGKVKLLQEMIAESESREPDIVQ